MMERTFNKNFLNPLFNQWEKFMKLTKFSLIDILTECFVRKIISFPYFLIISLKIFQVEQLQFNCCYGINIKRNTIIY